MSAQRPFGSLESTDRVAITGATGWLGRELLSRLASLRPDVVVLPIASHARDFSAGIHYFRSVEWDHFSLVDWKPTVFVHLAHLTRDREEIWGPHAYVRENGRLTLAAIKAAELPTVRAVVLASSGAAVASPESLYGRGKVAAESLFLDHGRRTGQPCVVARAWSVSGSLCPKPNLFALYDFIRQAKERGRISISASTLTFRRYVDAGEFLETCVNAAAAGVSSVIDSYGELVEMGELAERVLSTLKIEGGVLRVDPSGVPDYYAADSAAFEDWARDFGVHVSDLAEQIRRSSWALK